MDVGPNDKILIAASPIPGNEKSVYHMINELIRKGVRVCHDKLTEDQIARVYSGHEVACHSLTHPTLQDIEDDNEIVRQIEED